ncbi:hypothetical protein diail_10332 [Diaporthe ilicicola]|nr:hypothetical protein diail_10332 [Diaporthe ilicicola]
MAYTSARYDDTSVTGSVLMSGVRGAGPRLFFFAVRLKERGLIGYHLRLKLAYSLSVGIPAALADCLRFPPPESLISDSGDRLTFLIILYTTFFQEDIITTPSPHHAVTMVGSAGHRMLRGVRSHKKLRTEILADEMEDPKVMHRRQHSDSAPAAVSRIPSTERYARTHWPPIEWDPLKLNPPVDQDQAQSMPVKARESLPRHTQSLRSKQSYAGHELRRPRMHHSDSGFSLVVHDGFDFGFERGQALGRMIERNRGHDDDEVYSKGWPSPASSVDSGKSWFDHDDDDDDEEEAAVKRSNELSAPQTPQRRPQAASPDDPAYYLKRGGWKRRGIYFGGQTEEVYQKEDDAFDLP